MSMPARIVNVVIKETPSRVAQSVQCLTTDWTAGTKDFSSNLLSPDFGPTKPPEHKVRWGLFRGGKARPGHDADPLLVLRLRTSRSYMSCSPQRHPWGVEEPL
jgi:hypothetical protein